MERNDRPDNDVTRQLAPLVDDDAFITELSQGVDPSNGDDDLAALLLELRDNVHADMPPTPVVEGADDPEAAVIPIQVGKKNRPWLHGIIGAAAATVAIAGAGAVFLPQITEGGDTTVVELAGTLDELESRAAEGDMDATQELVNEARGLLRQLEVQSAEQEEGTEGAVAVPEATPVTVTQTVTETPAPSPQEEAEPVTTTIVSPPETVTETVTQQSVTTQTAVVTVTVQAPVRDNPLEPTAAPSEPGTGGGQGGQGGGGLVPPQVQQ